MYEKLDFPSAGFLVKKIKRWLYLGPVLLLLSLSAALLFPLPHPLFYVFLSCLGLLFCARYGLKGFYGVAFGFCVLGYFQMQPFADLQRIWCIGLLASLILSFFVTALCSTELLFFVEPLYKSLEKKEILHKQSIQQLQEKLEKITLELTEKSALLESMKTQNAMEGMIEPVSLQQISEALPVGEWEDRYKQLRKQFEEKSQILDQTRKELFEKDHHFLVLHREKMLAGMQEDTEMSKMMQIVSLLSEEKELLEQQLVSVEEIVTKLLREQG